MITRLSCFTYNGYHYPRAGRSWFLTEYNERPFCRLSKEDKAYLVDKLDYKENTCCWSFSPFLD